MENRGRHFKSFRIEKDDVNAQKVKSALQKLVATKFETMFAKLMDEIL